VTEIHVGIITGNKYHRALGHILNEIHITYSVGGLYKIMMKRNVVHGTESRTLKDKLEEPYCCGKGESSEKYDMGQHMKMVTGE
jgi:hypothetical protein